MEKENVLFHMDKFLAELEAYSNIALVKQMQLEVQWLKSRLLADNLVLPDWTLVIMKPIHDGLQMKSLELTRKDLVESIYKYMNK